MKLVKIMNHIKTQTPASPGQTAAHAATATPAEIPAEIPAAAAIAPPPPRFTHV